MVTLPWSEPRREGDMTEKHDYCNTFKPCKGIQLFSHETQDQRPHPVHQGQVLVRALNHSHTHTRQWEGGRRCIVGNGRRLLPLITTRIKPSHGKVRPMLLSLPIPFQACGLYGKILKRAAIKETALTNPSMTSLSEPHLTRPYILMLKSASSYHKFIIWIIF